MFTRTFKKATSVFLSVILIASIFALPGLFAGAVSPDPLKWTFDSETGKLTISGNGPIENLINEANPDNLWSEYADSIKEVYIEEGITSIPMFAFGEHENLEKVTIPSTVKTIGMQAFQSCTKLESIIIPDGVVELESNVFSFCSIKTVSIGKDLTDLDPTAFDFCKSLESFEVSKENPVFSSEDGVLFNKDKTKLIRYPVGNKRTEYTVPEGIKIIGKESFMDASALQEINLPDSVIQIDGNPFGGTGFFNNEDNWENEELYINDKYLIFAGLNEFISGAYEIKEGTKVIAGCAFMNCDLTSISIPASVVSVGESALRCPNLSEIIVAEDSKYLTSVDNVLFTKDMSELVCYPAAKEESSYVIPSEVKKIANYAFALSALNEIVFPEELTEIGEFAFVSSYNIKNITLPDSLISIGCGAFYDCHALESANFGSKLQIISDQAFYYCRELVSVKFPEDIKKIGEFSFYSCGKLESVYIPDSIEEIDRMAFSICETLKSVTIGVNSEAESNLYSVKPSEAVIGSYAFNGCANLTSAVINAKTLESCSFACCDALESLTLFDSLESIGYASFAVCDNIKDIYFYGTEESWNDVAIFGFNAEFLDGNFHAMFIETEKEGITFSYSSDCFDEEITFSVENLDGNGDFVGGGIYEMDGYDRVGLYVIKPVNKDGNVIQPKGKVEIRIPMPAGSDKKAEYAISHKFSDKGSELFATNPLIEYGDKPLYIIDDCFVFEVEKFSEFIVFVKSDEPDVPDTPDEPEKVTVSSVSIATLPEKTAYNYKFGSLDLTGLSLTVTYSDGSTETVTDTSKMNVTGFDSSKTGEQTVTVEYEGATASFNVTVSYAWWQWIIRILLLGFLWY